METKTFDAIDMPLNDREAFSAYSMKFKIKETKELINLKGIDKVIEEAKNDIESAILNINEQDYGE